MASLGQTFDATGVEPSAPRELLPPGDYPVQIVQSEMRDTKNGDGQFLSLEMEVLDGAHAGRKLWDRLNLVNRNAQAAEIAQRTLSAICHATGTMQVSDSEQLHFKPMLAKVTVKPAGPDRTGVHREAGNEVKGYSAVGGMVPGQRPAFASQPARQAPPQQPQQQPAQQPAARPAAGGTPPWRR